MPPFPYVELHAHSGFSFLDGASHPEELVLRAKELGYPALALTDHGNLHGALEFYRAAKGEGINPILGYEAYIAPGSLGAGGQGEQGRRLHLHAEDAAGAPLGHVVGIGVVEDVGGEEGADMRIDALGASRSDLRYSAGRQVINQFLSELDGVNTSNEGVLVLAATNAPWHVDPAFRRPGRFANGGS